VIDAVALRARLDSVRDRIASAARRAGRDPSSIRLVAVSKTFSADAIRILAETGLQDFGENKVQEAQAKIAALTGLPIRWHLVGHLQSNKARKAASLFNTIHSVDDASLLEKLDDAAVEAGRSLDVLVQADLAGEPTKHGAPVDSLLEVFAAGRARRGTRLKGLMILPPAVADAEAARPYFAAMRSVRDDLASRGVEPAMLAELSMGMSHDFEVAIEEGATLVRVGSAIFGEREHV
jgi:pyridoxal phosphate enzyme (YggS family)